MHIIPGQNHYYYNDINKTSFHGANYENIEYYNKTFNIILPKKDRIDYNSYKEPGEYSEIDFNIIGKFNLVEDLIGLESNSNNLTDSSSQNGISNFNLNTTNTTIGNRICTDDTVNRMVLSYISYEHSAAVNLDPTIHLARNSVSRQIMKDTWSFSFYNNLTKEEKFDLLLDFSATFNSTHYCIFNVFNNEPLNLENIFNYYLSEFSATTHYTIIFNCFIFMQLFNQLCCNDYTDNPNCWFFIESVTNSAFILIWLGEVFAQILIVQLTGKFFKVVDGGLSGKHWIITIGIGLIVFVVDIILKLGFLNNCITCKFKSRKKKIYSDDTSSFNFVPKRKVKDQKNALVVRTFSRAHSIQI